MLSHHSCQYTGGFGRFQKMLLSLTLIVSISCAFNHMSPIYTAFSPPFTCRCGVPSHKVVPIKSPYIFWVTSFVRLSITYASSGENSTFDSECPDGDVLEACGNFSFDQTVMIRSITTDFRLVCDRKSMVPAINSSYMAGVKKKTKEKKTIPCMACHAPVPSSLFSKVLIINLMSGFLSDRFGRRPVLLSYGLVHVLASYLTAFASTYWHFVVVR